MAGSPPLREGDGGGLQLDFFMNKKAYITPAIEVINVMAESSMMAASTYSNDSNYRVSAGEELTNERRGWGDLWQ